MSTRQHFLFLLVTIFVSLVLCGELIEVNSTTIGEAKIGRIWLALGVLFSEWIMYLFIHEYCEFKRNNLIVYTLLVIHVFCFAMVQANNTYHLYYAKMDFKIVNGYGHIITEPGFACYLHRVVIAYYVVAIPYICIDYYKKHKTKKGIKTALLLSLCIIIPAIGYIVSVVGVFGVYDITPIAYVISLIISFIMLINKRLFDTLEVARSNLISNLGDAVIVLDGDLQILYMNNKAKDIFPDVDDNFETCNMIATLCAKATLQYENDGKTYNLRMTNIHNGRKISGYTLVFSDVTELVDYAGQLEEQVKSKVSEIERIQHQVLISFANMIEMRDGMTGQHVKRTSEYVRVLIEGLIKRQMYKDELTEESSGIIISAAALHDIGKIAISDMILQKPGKLTNDEFEIIKTHSEIGGYIIDEVLKEVGNNAYLAEARKMAMHHHEKWDGSGYPDKLSGDSIPLSARIMAIADVFDALISKRQYKDAFSLDKAFYIIEESSGSHFDPELVAVFLEERPQIETVVEKLKDE